MISTPSSRRTVIAGAAFGLTGAAAPVTARQTTSAPADANPIDPRYRYRTEPFPEQRQPWPAL